MKLKYTLAAAALAMTTAANAQTWVNDTIYLGSSYANNVFYGLDSGTLKTQAANDWDIAIRANSYSVGVYANHASNGVRVYPYTDASAAAKFGTDLTADTAGLILDSTALYNSIESWEAGAFNMDVDTSNAFDYGWGVYSTTTHYITGDKIYFVLAGGTYYQLWIEQDQATASNAHWKFHVAKLDGTDSVTQEFDMFPTYSDRLFAYYSFSNQAFVDREPATDSWDLLFGKYMKETAYGTSTIMYAYTGVLLNENRGVYKLTGTGVQGTAYDSASMTPLFDSVISTIGADWKGSYSTTTGLYTTKDTITYFVSTASRDIWQLEFDYATLGSTPTGVEPGAMGFRKRKVYTYVAPEETGINNLNGLVNNIVVAPNPAENGRTNLLVDAKQTLQNAQITVTDISGRVVLHTTKTIPAGLQQIRIDLNQHPAGMYMVNLNGEGYEASLKVVK
ncbi:MAG: T9SS type A sorting domain-containing protein [Edaphocola sp.]